MSVCWIVTNLVCDSVRLREEQDCVPVLWRDIHVLTARLSIVKLIMLQHQFPFIIDCIYLSDASIREEDDDELSFGKLSLAYQLLSLYTAFMTPLGVARWVTENMLVIQKWYLWISLDGALLLRISPVCRVWPCESTLAQQDLIWPSPCVSVSNLFMFY